VKNQKNGGGGTAPTPNPPSGDGDTPQRLNLGTYGILTLTTPPLKISGYAKDDALLQNY